MIRWQLLKILLLPETTSQSSQVQILPAYRRFLARRLREEFGFDGTPFRLHFRKRRSHGDSKDG